jgi:hypothetical protein
LKNHFIDAFKGKVRDAHATLVAEGAGGGVKMERRAVVAAVKALAKNAFNDEKNLFIDLGDENSGLQEVLDTAHPEILEKKARQKQAAIDKKVAQFISAHGIGGKTFKVTSSKVTVIDWEVVYV